MTVFDLLFILVCLLSVVTLLAVLGNVTFGRGNRALRILRVYGGLVAIYLAIVVVTSLISSREILKVGESKCYDDWCIGVERFDRTIAASKVTYRVTLRLSSRARRVSQRERGVAVYMLDTRNRRFDPVTDPSAGPLDSLLRPQQSVYSVRVFVLPTDAKIAGLAIAHEGGFPIEWFIIGGGPFHKPPIVSLR